ncbi:hypothetical protein HN587_04580 [Candidatus Woesearchaeota archaeon]|jgi:hypothetical protein|nr:hypothetical protein [Candidatus Woesearchaeota archaeon]
MVEAHVKRILEHDDIIANINAVLNYPRDQEFGKEQFMKFLQLNQVQLDEHIRVAVESQALKPVHAQVEIRFLKEHLGVYKTPESGLKKVMSKFGLKEINAGSIAAIYIAIYSETDKIQVLNKLKILCKHIVEISNKESKLVKDMRALEEDILAHLTKIEINVLGKGAKQEVQKEEKEADAKEKLLENDNLSEVSAEVQKMIDDKRIVLNQKTGRIEITKNPKSLEDQELLLIKFLAVTLHFLHISSLRFLWILKEQDVQLGNEVKLIDKILSINGKEDALLKYFEEMLKEKELLVSDPNPNQFQRIDIYHEKFLIDKIFGYVQQLKIKLEELNKVITARKKGHFLIPLKNVKVSVSHVFEGKHEYVENTEIRLEDCESPEVLVGSSKVLGNWVVVSDKKNVIPKMFSISKDWKISVFKRNTPTVDDPGKLAFAPVVVKRSDGWFYLSLEDLPLLKLLEDKTFKSQLKIPKNQKVYMINPVKEEFVLADGDIIQCGTLDTFKFEVRDESGKVVKQNPLDVETEKVKEKKKEQDYEDNLLDAITEWDNESKNSKPALANCGFNDLINFLVNNKKLGGNIEDICKKASIDKSDLIDFWMYTLAGKKELIALSIAKPQKTNKDGLPEYKFEELMALENSFRELKDHMLRYNETYKKIARKKRYVYIAFKLPEELKFNDLDHLCAHYNILRQGFDYLWEMLTFGKPVSDSEREARAKLADELDKAVRAWDDKTFHSGDIELKSGWLEFINGLCEHLNITGDKLIGQLQKKFDLTTGGLKELWISTNSVEKWAELKSVTPAKLRKMSFKDINILNKSN